MGWFKTKIDSWVGKKFDEEINGFVQSLRGMDAAELGYVVALATHLRHMMQSSGHQVMTPIIYANENSGFIYSISTAIKEAQKQGQFQKAAGLMVWHHTLRASIRPEIRLTARDMWSQLSRGFPHVLTAAANFKALKGIDLNTEGSNDFPLGFSPEPLR